MTRSAFLSSCLVALVAGCLVLLLGAATVSAAPRNLLWQDLLPENPSLAAQGQLNVSLSGQEIRLSGFVVPLERDQDNHLCEFLLVPYFGACIHVPPPPVNQIVHVRLPKGVNGVETMDSVTVCGRLMLDEGDGQAGYELVEARLEQESAKGERPWLAWLLTALCGLSVCFGWVGPFAGRKISDALTCLAMSCASGMLLGLGLSALYANASLKAACAFAITFILLALLLRGHGHAHSGHSDLAVAAGLGLHNYPECFLVLTISLASGPMGFALAIAMLAHNVPLGISLALGLPQSSRATVCAFVAGVLPPLLAMATYAFVRAIITPESMRLLMSAAGGVLTALALRELLPHALQLGSVKRVGMGFALGLFVLFLIMLALYLGLF